MYLLNVPMEVLSLFVELLDFDSVFNLSRCCRALHDIIMSDTICRLALKKLQCPGSEAQEHHGRSKTFRIEAKRRNAILQAEPFLVAIVALVETFVYSDGLLCYTFSPDISQNPGQVWPPRSLHILDVHCSAKEESVVDLFGLLKDSVPEFDATYAFSFQPVHCSHNILSCLYSYENDYGIMINWLVSFRVDNFKCVISHLLDSAHKLFVRNNDTFLILGTKSHRGRDGFDRWSLERLDLRHGKILDDNIVLWNFTGSCIGRDVCFEIFDEYFYCLSIKDKRLPEYGRWNSFYFAMRFPLSEVTRHRCERPLKTTLWRRHNAKEGQVDHRWNSLQIKRDKSSGKLFIFEDRREWLIHNPNSQRSCYKKELCFDITEPVKPRSRLPDIIRPDEDSSSDEIEEDDDFEDDEWEEAYFESRPPENVHVGDNGTNGTTMTLKECLVHSYHASTEAFLDLQHDSGCIKLRVRPKVRNAQAHADASLGTADDRATDYHSSTRGTDSQEARLMHHGVKLWPPDHVAPDGPVMTRLKNVLRPPDEFDSVDWAMDEKSLVYTAGRAVPGGLRPLVLMSFDPSIHLAGYPKLSFVDAEAGSSYRVPSYGGQRLVEPVVAEVSTGSSAAQSAYAVSSAGNAAVSSDPSNNLAATASIPSWVQRQKAFYLWMSQNGDFPFGFDLSL